jgi:hypothetical protein
MADAPLQRLHAAHRRTDHGDQMLDPELLFHQAKLGLDHVADREFRELHARLRLGIARRCGQTVPDRVGADDEIFVGVERLSRADHEIDPVMISRDRRHHQDGVGFVGIQRAVGHIGDREVLDHFTAFEREVSLAVELVRWLLRRVRRGWRRH